MVRKTPNAWLLQIALGLMLFIGLSPISTILSKQAGHMQTMAQRGTIYNTASTSRDTSMPCCNDLDIVCSFSSICGFVIPNSDFATQSAGTNRVAFSTFSIQIGSREIVTPPPKI